MEDNNNNAQQTPEQTTNNTGANINVDYDKLASVLDKRQEGIAKSYLKEQGLSGDELNEAIKTFKANKQAQSQEKEQNFANMQNENVTLKAQLQEMQLNSTAMNLAGELGVDAKTIPYLVKMADLKEAFKDGQVNQEAVKTALDKVLADLPMLKPNKNKYGFVKIGADVKEQNTNSQEDDLRKAFGLK